MKYTDEQVAYLKNSKMICDRLNPLVQYWLQQDLDDLPSNIHLLFDHVLTEKPSKQIVHFIDQDIYYCDYSTTLHRYIPNDARCEHGWYEVENCSRLPFKVRTNTRKSTQTDK
jgi:hypothetical protein